MTQEEFQDLLKKHRRGGCTEQERKLIEDWFAAISISEKAFSDAQEELLSKASIWENVDQHITTETQKALPERSRAHWPLIAVAASVAVALMVLIYTGGKTSLRPVVTDSFNSSQTGKKILENKSTHLRELILPDNSHVRLFPGSRITYSEPFQSTRRKVYLDGEAYFDVAHDASRPFLVYTNALTTRVLGTSFFIKAYKGQKESVVSVQAGKVSVYTNLSNDSGLEPQQEVILSPNEEVVYNAGDQLTLKKLVNTPQVILPYPTLKNRYTNAPVIDILASLEENYGIDIRYDSTLLLNCTLTSDMSEEGFYEQIRIICNALGAQYKVEETVVVIDASGCRGR